MKDAEGFQGSGAGPAHFPPPVVIPPPSWPAPSLLSSPPFSHSRFFVIWRRLFCCFSQAALNSSAILRLSHFAFFQYQVICQALQVLYFFAPILSDLF